MSVQRSGFRQLVRDYGAARVTAAGSDVNVAGTMPLPLGISGTMAVEVVVNATLPLGLLESGDLDNPVEGGRSGSIGLGLTGHINTTVVADSSRALPLAVLGDVFVLGDAVLSGVMPLPLALSATGHIEADDSVPPAGGDGTSPIPWPVRRLLEEQLSRPPVWPDRVFDGRMALPLRVKGRVTVRAAVEGRSRLQMRVQGEMRLNDDALVFELLDLLSLTSS